MSDLREKIIAEFEDAVDAARKAYTKYSYSAQNEAVERDRFTRHARGLLNRTKARVLALLPPSPDTASTSLVLGGNGSYSASEEAVANAATEGEASLLPYDVTIGHIRFRKGVKLETFINAARRWFDRASAAYAMETYTLSNGALPRHGKPLSDAMPPVSPVRPKMLVDNDWLRRKNEEGPDLYGEPDTPSQPIQTSDLPPHPTGCAEGWRMVPVEPTEEVIKAVEFAIYRYSDCNVRDAERGAPHAYRAMIQAAPQPPPPEPL